MKILILQIIKKKINIFRQHCIEIEFPFDLQTQTRHPPAPRLCGRAQTASGKRV
ncbi:MAG: hypothetical protein Q4A98_05500 [Comamonadaceae bacterium]|nr:hypothetical protein [Comamonadaceae bacterium]